MASILCKESQTCRGCLRARQSVTTHRELTRQNVWVPRTRVTRHTLVCAPGAQGGCSHAHKTAWGRECGAWANPRPYPLGRPQRKLREESLLRGQPWRPDPLQRMLLNLGLGGKSPWACKPSGQKGFFFFFWTAHVKEAPGRDFPGGPVATARSSQYRGPRFDPWSGN